MEEGPTEGDSRAAGGLASISRRASDAGTSPARPHLVLRWVLWASPLAIVASVLGLALSAPTAEDAWAIPLYSVIVATWGVAGAFVTTRRTDNRVGWVMWIAGTTMGVALLGSIWSWASFSSTDASLPGTAAGAVVGLLFQPALFLILLVPLIFPDGRVLSRRWSIVVVAGLTAVAATLLGSLVKPGPIDGAPWADNPFGVPELAEVAATVVDVSGTLSILLLPAGILAVALRYRRGTSLERKQIKWFSSAVVLALSMFLLAVLFPEPWGQLAWVVASLALALLPVAIGVAVLRYRLYEIDTIINRAIVYGLATAILAGVISASIGVAQRLFEDVLGQGSDATIIVTTLVVVAAFDPLRKRLQTVVDRRFKEDHGPAATLSAFVDAVRQSFGRPEIERTVRMLLPVVARAYRASSVEARLSVADTARTLAHGDPAPAAATPSLTVSASAAQIALTVRVYGGYVESEAGALGVAIEDIVREAVGITTPGDIVDEGPVTSRAAMEAAGVRQAPRSRGGRSAAAEDAGEALRGSG